MSDGIVAEAGVLESRHLCGAARQGLAWECAPGMS